MTRTVLAAIVGGLIVFIWSAASHMLLPLGTAGLSILPDEARVTGAIRTSAAKPGFYIFPAYDMQRKHTKAEEDAWLGRYRSGPVGILVLQPGSEPMSPRQLVLEFVSDVIAAFIAVMILVVVPGTLVRRAIIAALLAAFAFLSLTVSEWVWYGFPTAYILASAFTEIIGWFLAGLAMGKIAPTRA